jgi:hypothetical protein
MIEIEIEVAITKLKQGKSTGPHVILPEHVIVQWPYHHTLLGLRSFLPVSQVYSLSRFTKEKKSIPDLKLPWQLTHLCYSKAIF